jgi:hypothetical protein
MLYPSRKPLVDTVKKIAYRTGTALASIVCEELAWTNDARSRLRDLFRSEADVLPDLEQGTLRVQVHPVSNPRFNRAIAHLLELLNAVEFTNRGTNLRLDLPAGAGMKCWDRMISALPSCFAR